MVDPHAPTPPNRLRLATIPLHVGAALYVLLALALVAFLLLLVFPDITERGERMAASAAVLFVIVLCLGIAALSEAIVWGLGRRKMWAWIAGLCVFAMYVPSLFFPLGALGLWGLLDPGSRALFGLGPAATPVSPGAPGGAASPSRWSPGCIAGVVCAVALAVFALPVLGIIAAIAIPNYLDATQRAKQLRTMADIRVIGTSVEAARGSTGALPTATGIEELLAELGGQPGGVAPDVTGVDGWGRPLRYACWSADPAGGCTSYTVASAGRDGVFEHEDLRLYSLRPQQPQETAATPAASHDRDIVLVDGFFVQAPGVPPGG